MNVAQFVSGLAADGRYTFTIDEVVRALGLSLVAARAALRRLAAKAEIARPYRGFWVIVPPEYRKIGCLPPEQFIPSLMSCLGETYYTGLLTAAEYHGAAHHRPQVFQVVVAKNRPELVCGKVRVRFVARRNVAELPTLAFKTPRGFLAISTPEGTAFDLVGYPDRAGGLDNVVTTLLELADNISADKLVSIADLSPLVWSQRLGFLLDLAGASNKTVGLAEYVRLKNPPPAPLVRTASCRGVSLNVRWRIMVNAEVDVEP